MSSINNHPSNRRGKKTHFHYAPKEKQKQQKLLLVGVFVCLAALVLGLYHIIRYAGEHVAHQQNTEEIRDAYYTARQDEQNGELPGQAQNPEGVDDPGSNAAALQAQATAVPAATAAPVRSGMLPLVHFPGNFNAKVRDSFQVLRLSHSPDIMGWLKIGTTLDEPVVQKDNTYYLRRDYKGNDNNNGTLFLDEGTQWKTRPYTLMIYGHNMKSGAMFGHLKSYEKADYFQDHAIITFDNAFEDGRYVVFAVGTYSLKNGHDQYVSLSRLDSRDIGGREKEIRQLQAGAVKKANVDVQAEDQLLLLITCVDDDNERRILAARRVRENETEQELIRQVKDSFAK